MLISLFIDTLVYLKSLEHLLYIKAYLMVNLLAYLKIFLSNQ